MEMEQENIDLSEIKDIIVRRRWSMIIPAAAVFALAVIVAGLQGHFHDPHRRAGDPGRLRYYHRDQLR